MKTIKTIDAEVAGEAVRLIIEGGPSVTGRTMMEKLNWLRRHGSDLRRLLMLEPRGHAGMHGAMLTEPVSQQGHAGLLSMHPLDDKLKGIQGTIFTGPPRAQGDLRSATVLDGEVLRRSPGATGTAALMAVLYAMGLLTEGRRFTHEGVLGTALHGSVANGGQAGDLPSLIPVIEGSASITGFHEFVGS